MLVVFGSSIVISGAFRKFCVNNTKEFGVRKVALTTSTGQPTELLTEDRIAEVTGLAATGSQTIFQFDEEALERALVKLPEVRQAKVQRRFPDTFRVEVDERLPVAWLVCKDLGLIERDAERGLLLDKDGVALSCCTQVIWNYSARLPVVHVRTLPGGEGGSTQVASGLQIESEGVKRALALLTEIGEPANEDHRPDWVIVKDNITLVTKFHDGSRIDFSYYGHKKELQKLDYVRKHAVSQGKKINHTSVIPDTMVPVSYR